MLSFSDVVVRYNGAQEAALRNFDLEVDAGERVALIGPSGAGKSTVLALANGLVLPTTGTVKVFGVDTVQLGRRSNRATRRRIASVQQQFALVGPLRVAHNVAAGKLGSWTSLQAVRSLIRPAHVSEITASLERMGIAEKLWVRTDQLSGGQQQRTAIARALFQEGDLLLADEPLSALDPARSDAVLGELVAAVSEDPQRTLVTSLHDAPLATKHCDRVVGLRDGVLVFDAKADEVTESMLTELYELDNRGIGSPSDRSRADR